MSNEGVDRMKRIEERIKVLVDQLDQLTKIIEDKNKYIKHLEKMLDERLRVV